MKMTKVLLSIAVLGLIMNLSASVRINGLGSYFEYLVPDTETDIELFPSHLSEFESRYVQVFNNYNSPSYDWYGAKNIHLSIMPLSRKLSIRINADIASDDNEPRIYLNDLYSRRSTEFVGREYGASLVNNSLSYELTDSFHLGCFFKYGVNWKDIDDESLEIENSDLIIYEELDNIDFNSDFISTGINLSFGSNHKTDISLMYSVADIEDFDIHKRDYQRNSAYDDFSRTINENSVKNVTNTEDMGIAILLETNNEEKEIVIL